MRKVSYTVDLVRGNVSAGIYTRFLQCGHSDGVKDHTLTAVPVGVQIFEVRLTDSTEASADQTRQKYGEILDFRKSEREKGFGTKTPTSRSFEVLVLAKDNDIVSNLDFYHCIAMPLGRMSNIDIQNSLVAALSRLESNHFII